MTIMHSGRSAGRSHTSLTPKALALLDTIQDYLPDHARVKTLHMALQQGEALDIIRMLAHQWNRGLSTLSGDQTVIHPEHVSIAATGQFMAAVRATLEKDSSLTVTESHTEMLENLVRHLRGNQPLHAAWDATLLWLHQSKLN